jgi:hypothetical protein
MSRSTISTFQLKGVSWDRKTNNWRVQVQSRRSPVFRVWTKEETNAAQIYNFIAFELWGEFACLNSAICE